MHLGVPRKGTGDPALDALVDATRIEYLHKLEERRAAYAAGQNREAEDREAAELDRKLQEVAALPTPERRYALADRRRDLAFIRGESATAIDTICRDAAREAHKMGRLSVIGDLAGRLKADLAALGLQG